jgi:hypothetical protein
MQCFDCVTEFQRATEAVAVCTTCGAATCGPHTVTGDAREEVQSVGNPSVHVLPGRRLYCRTCAPAGAAATIRRAHTHGFAVR